MSLVRFALLYFSLLYFSLLFPALLFLHLLRHAFLRTAYFGGVLVCIPSTDFLSFALLCCSYSALLFCFFDVFTHTGTLGHLIRPPHSPPTVPSRLAGGGVGVGHPAKSIPGPLLTGEPPAELNCRLPGEAGGEEGELRSGGVGEVLKDGKG